MFFSNENKKTFKDKSKYYFIFSQFEDQVVYGWSLQKKDSLFHLYMNFFYSLQIL